MKRSLDRERDRAQRETSWRSVLSGYVLLAVFFVGLVAVSYPLDTALALSVAGGLFVGARHAVRLGRCLRDCGAFSLDLGGRVRITVARTDLDD